jgi:F-type H+-transporting ATPase subunit epsilon
MAQLTCVVVTPEETAVEQTADFVALPLYDGEIGIAPGHSPLIGRLGYGELRVRSGKEVTRYYIDGGFVQVADNVVSVLTERAVVADQLDPAAADGGSRAPPRSHPRTPGKPRPRHPTSPRPIACGAADRGALRIRCYA